jgi:hypothetical protein
MVIKAGSVGDVFRCKVWFTSVRFDCHMGKVSNYLETQVNGSIVLTTDDNGIKRKANCRTVS